jgi:hypothetical protein
MNPKKPSALLLASILLIPLHQASAQSPKSIFLKQLEESEKRLYPNKHIPLEIIPGERRAQRLLRLRAHDFGQYRKFCSEAKTLPKIGMTTIEARETTYCFPTKINKTITTQGELRQEVYEIYSDSWYHIKTNYLYFQNDILVSIQE